MITLQSISKTINLMKKIIRNKYFLSEFYIIKSRMIVTSPYTKLWKIILYNHPGFLFTQLSFILLFLPAY